MPDSTRTLTRRSVLADGKRAGRSAVSPARRSPRSTPRRDSDGASDAVDPPQRRRRGMTSRHLRLRTRHHQGRDDDLEGFTLEEILGVVRGRPDF